MSVGLRGLHASIRPYAEYSLQVARAYGIEPRVTSTLRTWNQQQALYDAYKRSVADGTFQRPGGVQFPANPPGFSAHEWGLAWDSVVPANQQDAWDAIRRWVGWEVLDNDRIHAQVPRWRDYVQLPA